MQKMQKAELSILLKLLSAEKEDLLSRKQFLDALEVQREIREINVIFENASCIDGKMSNMDIKPTTEKDWC